MRFRLGILAALLTSGTLAASSQAEPVPPAANRNFSFFVTSKGSGDGGNLGGIAGADRICSTLAAAAGSQRRVWRAFLSTNAEGSQPAINARDRIGKGPWYNSAGAQVGRNVDDLFRPGSPINKETVLDERGSKLNGRGDTPNRHDILTGSTPEGRLAGASTCNNWKSNSAGTARLGHFDRTGGGDNPTSWISAHDSRSCSQQDLVATGGDGLFYCFAPR